MEISFKNVLYERIETLENELAEAHALIVDSKKHIDALKEVLNEYVPVSQLDEANNRVIELTKGSAELVGKALLNNYKG